MEVIKTIQHAIEKFRIIQDDDVFKIQLARKRKLLWFFETDVEYWKTWGRYLIEDIYAASGKFIHRQFNSPEEAEKEINWLTSCNPEWLQMMWFDFK